MAGGSDGGGGGGGGGGTGHTGPAGVEPGIAKRIRNVSCIVVHASAATTRSAVACR